MKKINAYFGIILLFLAGICVGSVGHSAWIKAKIQRFQNQGPALLRTANMQKMTQRLNLNEKQRNKILGIMEETQLASSELRKKHRKESYELQRITVQRVSNVLDKDQKVEFRKALTSHYIEQKKIREMKSPSNGLKIDSKPAPVSAKGGHSS